MVRYRGNTLLVSNPELVAEWGTQNATTPNDHKPGDRTRVWWTCPKGHPEYKAAIANRRLIGTSCSKCTVVPRGKSFADLAPHLLQQWSSKNTFTPNEIYAKSITPVIWECEVCFYEWTTRAAYRVDKDRGCPDCHGMVIGKKSILILRPDLALQWSPKNIKPANQVALGSKNLAYWICPEGHEYEMRPFELRDGSFCPTCRLKTGSLLTKYPNIAREFDMNKNGGKTASDFMSATSEPVFWLCDQQHSWKAQISNRTQNNTGCPDCVKTSSSKIEEVLRQAFHDDAILQNIPLQRNVKLNIPWRNRQVVQVDIAATYKDQPVVIEYDGWYWHSGQRKNDAETPLVRDIAKTLALLEAGYLVVRVREIRKNQVLSFLPLETKDFLQFHWNHLKHGDNTDEIRETVYAWLHSL